jgi:hypothetical protein
MLRVQNLWKQQAYFPVSFAETSVEEATQMVANDIGVDASQLKLIYCGQKLSEGSLSNFGITSDGTVFALTKLGPQTADFQHWQPIAAAAGSSPGGNGAAGSAAAKSAAAPLAAPDPCVVDPRWERARRPFY